MKGKKYPVILTGEEKKRLLEIIKKGNHPARQIVRANILLHLNEETNKQGYPKPVPLQEEIARRCRCETALIYKVSKQYAKEGIERALNRKKRETPPVPGIITGEVEAKIIALCAANLLPDTAVGPYGSWEPKRWNWKSLTIYRPRAWLLF
jgi:hypothetical protein